MNSSLPPGSWLLQGAFYLLAAGVLVLPDAAIKRGSAACGDSSELTRTRLRRYRMLAAGWVAVVVAAVGSGLLSPETTRPLPFAAMMLSVLTLGVVLARSEAGDRIARGVPLAYLIAFQGFRFPLEMVMHRAYSEGLMPVQMSYSGRNFDIVTDAGICVLRPRSTQCLDPAAPVYVPADGARSGGVGGPPGGLARAGGQAGQAGLKTRLYGAASTPPHQLSSSIQAGSSM